MMESDIFVNFLKNNIETTNKRDLSYKNYVLDFGSNDYLCLSQDLNLITKTFEDCLREKKIGAGGSRLLINNNYLIKLEELISSIKKKDRALIFPSGFQLNSTIIPIIIDVLKFNYNDKVDVFTDRLIHSSIHYGLNYAQVKQIRYNHNDLNHLESLLKKSNNQKILFTETIFSMDGTILDIKNLIFLKKKYNFLLYVDDAHSFGVFGENLYGITERYEEDIDILIGTFSKAIGCQGGYACVSEDLKEIVINKCSGFIYSTGISNFLSNFAFNAILNLGKKKEEVEKMLTLADYTRDSLKDKFEVLGQSQIIPIIIPDIEKLLRFKAICEMNNINISIIRSPTVPKGRERVRISLNIKHTKDDIDKLIEIFNNI